MRTPSRLPIVASLFVVAICDTNSLAATHTLGRVDLIKAVGRHRAFKLESGEATVGGQLIKRVEIGNTSAVITYFNRSGDAMRPNYTFFLVDDYGLVVASFQDKWNFLRIEAAEAKKEDKTFDILPLDGMLKHSDIVLPADWSTPIYLWIEGDEP